MGPGERLRARRPWAHPIARRRGLQGCTGRDQGEGHREGGPEAADPREEELKLTSADAGSRARQLAKTDTRGRGVTRQSSTVDDRSSPPRPRRDCLRSTVPPAGWAVLFRARERRIALALTDEN